MIQWDGNYLCEKGYYINLKSRPDRMERCIQELEKAKITGVERFEAVKIENEVFKHYGCTQSHIDIAKLQIENNWPYVLYLEDDIVFDVMYTLDVRNSKRKLDYGKIVTSLIKDLYEYKPDVLWLGTRLEQPVEKKISNTLVVPNRTLMSHAYLGSLKYAKFLVEHLRYEDSRYFSSRYPIDWFITQLREKNCGCILDESWYYGGDIMRSNDLAVMVSVPQFFVQGSGLSDISGVVVDYRTWCSDAYSAYVRLGEFGIEPYYATE